MEERQVSVEGTPRPLPDPFLVAATQNPIEYEGTYPLPEAQLDRFLVKLTVAVPGREEEIGILARHAAGFDPSDLTAAGIGPVAGAADLAAARAAVGRVAVAPEVTGYIVDLCRATRQSPSLRLGVSRRGATALQATARADHRGTGAGDAAGQRGYQDRVLASRPHRGQVRRRLLVQGHQFVDFRPGEPAAPLNQVVQPLP